MTIIFTRLILTILYLDELAIQRPRIKAQRHQCIDRRRLGHQRKRPTLRILELYEVAVVLHDLVFLVAAALKSFDKRNQCPAVL